MKSKIIEITFVAIVLLVILVTGGAGWYYFFGSKPKLALTLPVSEKGAGVQDVRVIGWRDLVVLADGQVHHYVGLREKWTKPLTAESPAEQYKQELLEINERFANLRTWSESLNQRRAQLKTVQQIEAFNAEAAKYHAELRSAQADDARVRAALAGKKPPENPKGAAGPEKNFAWEGMGSLQHLIFADTDSIWIVASREATQFDRQTGEHKKQIRLPGEPEYAAKSGDKLFIVAHAPGGSKRLFCVGMQDGKADELMISGDSLPSAQDYRTPDIVSHRTEFVASNGALVQLDADLIERRVVERKAMRPMDANPKSTAKTGWSDGAVEVAKMMADDNQREMTGGVDRIDESRYSVTLRRDFANPAVKEWKGEMEGRPLLYHAKTVDLVIADRRLFVFDGANHQKWAAQLTYPIKLPLQSDPETCCLEHDGNLYVWDAGFLTAFHLADGQVRWRIPSVGIQSVAPSTDGMLYVSTANRSAETLTYTQQSTLGDPVKPLLMKIDPAKGDVLWRAEGLQQAYVSGRYVYGTRIPVNTLDTVNSVFTRKSAQERFFLCKLRRNSGKNDWDYFEGRIPEKIEPDGRDVVMVFPHAVDVITSWAF